jgi:hypothetical protein
MSSKWREILERVERGELSAEQGAALMGGENYEAPAPAPVAAAAPDPVPAQSAVGAEAPQPPQPQPEPDPELEARLDYWKRWWLIPLWVGMGVFLVGAGLIAWAYGGQRTFWFVCGFFPLLFGLLVMATSWWSQTARWVHIRIREEKNGSVNRVVISLPVPIRLLGWALRLFGGRIPGLSEQKDVRDSLPILFEELERSRDPISIEVQDKNGSDVRVYIT